VCITLTARGHRASTAWDRLPAPVLRTTSPLPPIDTAHQPTPSATHTQLFTGATAALPCEVGPDGRPVRAAGSRQAASGPLGFLQPSKYQAMWEKRVAAQRAAREQQEM
jgi:hypothetical protein